MSFHRLYIDVQIFHGVFSYLLLQNMCYKNLFFSIESHSNSWVFLSSALLNVFSQNLRRCSEFSWSVFLFAVAKNVRQKRHLCMCMYFSLERHFNSWVLLTSTLSNVFSQNLHRCSYFSWSVFLSAVAKYLLQKRHLCFFPTESHSNSWVFLTSALSNVFSMKLRACAHFSWSYMLTQKICYKNNTCFRLHHGSPVCEVSCPLHSEMCLHRIWTHKYVHTFHGYFSLLLL